MTLPFIAATMFAMLVNFIISALSNLGMPRLKRIGYIHNSLPVNIHEGLIM